MSLNFTAALRGDLIAWSKAQTKAVESATAAVIRRRTTNLKNGIRRQIDAARLGKLGQAVRGEVIRTTDGRDITKRGDGSAVRGRVWSKAIKKGRPGGLVDLISVFDTGTTITARGGKWIALPTRIAGKLSTPDTYKNGLIFKQRKGASTAVLTFKGRPNVVAFVLVKQVTIRKRLRIASAYATAVRGLDDLVAREVERRVTRAAGKVLG